MYNIYCTACVGVWLRYSSTTKYIPTLSHFQISYANFKTFIKGRRKLQRVTSKESSNLLTAKPIARISDPGKLSILETSNFVQPGEAQTIWFSSEWPSFPFLRFCVCNCIKFYKFKSFKLPKATAWLHIARASNKTAFLLGNIVSSGMHCPNSCVPYRRLPSSSKTKSAN